jgi:hypothetical protein
MLVEIPELLTEFSRGFTKSLQENAGIVTRSSFRLALCRLRYGQRGKMNHKRRMWIKIQYAIIIMNPDIMEKKSGCVQL